MEFQLKHIRFCGRHCSIICQNENGPCPLLAIANALILSNRIVIKSDRNVISLNKLLQVIANQITDSAYNENTSNAEETQEVVETALTLLPRLDKGLTSL